MTSAKPPVHHLVLVNSFLRFLIHLLLIDEMQEWFVNLKNLVEDTFNKTSQKVIFITHRLEENKKLIFFSFFFT